MFIDIITPGLDPEGSFRIEERVMRQHPQHALSLFREGLDFLTREGGVVVVSLPKWEVMISPDDADGIYRARDWEGNWSTSTCGELVGSLRAELCSVLGVEI